MTALYSKSVGTKDYDIVLNKSLEETSTLIMLLKKLENLDYSWAFRPQSLSVGNKSYSLAVLPLHRFISILIFMYLEKAFVLFSPETLLAQENNFLEF